MNENTYDIDKIINIFIKKVSMYNEKYNIDILQQITDSFDKIPLNNFYDPSESSIYTLFFYYGINDFLVENNLYNLSLLFHNIMYFILAIDDYNMFYDSNIRFQPNKNNIFSNKIIEIIIYLYEIINDMKEMTETSDESDELNISKYNKEKIENINIIVFQLLMKTIENTIILLHILLNTCSEYILYILYILKNDLSQSKESTKESNILIIFYEYIKQNQYNIENIDIIDLQQLFDVYETGEYTKVAKKT